VRDPWSKDAPAKIYLFVDSTASESDIPDIPGAVTINVPLQSALVYSSVHASAFDELGTPETVTGVADGNYFTFGPFPEAIRNGKIKDIGNSMSPSLEAIVELSPDAALVSPYQNAGHGVLDNTGVPIIEMADYMEPTPLGRAEWILVIGAATGRLDRASEIYNRVVEQYEATKASVANTPDRPVVITDLPAFGTWYQPGGQSYAATLIRDAGGLTVTENDSSTGSLQLDEAAAFDLAADADIWLVKTDHPVTPSEIASSGVLASKVKAFRDNNVWAANTSIVPYFDDVTFHPERILRDYAAIFTGQTDSLRYFRPVFPSK
ncbi:MAG: ABC transporter substrate-binding protein, partial [Muribaculaceae bacterium]|nr:ABC transporter substrate-binding protein [Muribaculaceae bacterium]